MDRIKGRKLIKGKIKVAKRARKDKGKRMKDIRKRTNYGYEKNKEERKEIESKKFKKIIRNEVRVQKDQRRNEEKEREIYIKTTTTTK